MSGRTPFSSYLDVFSKPRAAGCDTRDPSDPTSPEVFTSQSLWVPCGARGVFGGQVIAQSLVAAGKTISAPLGLHSQHCYFVLPALASPPIEFHVERLRDGRSYATRLVRAVQRNKVIFVLIASYTLPPSALPPLAQSGTPFSFTPMVDTASPEEAQTRRSTPVSHSLRFAVEQPTSGGDFPSQHRGWRAREGTSIPPFAPRFQIAFPEEVLVPEQCEEEEDRWQRFLDEAGQSQTAKRKTSIEEYIQERRESPVSIAVAKRKLGRLDFEANVRMIWVKARLAPDERPDEETAKAMIAYMTDFQFIGTAARSVGLTWTSSPRLGMLASLDHTTHFYPFPKDFDPAEPMLHVMEGTIADVASGRGVVRGLVYTKGGRLVASTLQEGVVRADLGRPERGLVEGGGVGETGEAKAKL